MKSTKHGNICKAISWPLKKNLAGDWKRTPGADEASSNQTNIRSALYQILSRWPNQAKVLAEQEFHIGDGLEGLDGVPAPLQDHELETLRDCDRLFSVWWVKKQKFLRIM